MIRRTFLNRVHLFTALVPVNIVGTPNLIHTANLDIAKKAAQEAEPFIGKAPLLSALDILADVSNVRDQRRVENILEECITSYRSELYKSSVSDPFQRLQLHEAIMAAGFYQRAANPNVLKGENTRFVLNHYNFDVRRDTNITRTVHDTLLASRQSTPQSDKLLNDLLLLERRLFGRLRFAPTSGRQWFVLGLPTEDIQTEADILRVFDIPAVKENGHLDLTWEDSEKLWKTVTVSPKPETGRSLAEDGVLLSVPKEKELRFSRRVQKPQPPMEFWDRFKDALLRYWVIWFSLWIMFFMVDEEILTVVALIFLKWRQTRILEEEAERTGGKVYIASSTGRSRENN